MPSVIMGEIALLGVLFLQNCTLHLDGRKRSGYLELNPEWQSRKRSSFLQIIQHLFLAYLEVISSFRNKHQISISLNVFNIRLIIYHVTFFL
jgi:hypothetical protein